MEFLGGRGVRLIREKAKKLGVKSDRASLNSSKLIHLDTNLRHEYTSLRSENESTILYIG